MPEKTPQQVFEEIREACSAFVRIATDFARHLDVDDQDSWRHLAIIDFLEQEIGPLGAAKPFTSSMDSFEDLLHEMVEEEVAAFRKAGLPSQPEAEPDDPKPALHRQLTVLAQLLNEVEHDPAPYWDYIHSDGFTRILENKSASGKFDHRIAEIFKNGVSAVAQ